MLLQLRLYLYKSLHKSIDIQRIQEENELSKKIYSALIIIYFNKKGENFINFKDKIQ